MDSSANPQQTIYNNRDVAVQAAQLAVGGNLNINQSVSRAIYVQLF
jgi:hypothetical protein